MPGHFTHVYTARRLADWLEKQDRFNPNDSDQTVPGLGALTGGNSGLTPQRCGELMKKWPKYTNVGAIGPDLFFFCQDYSGAPFAESPYACDTLMLAMAVYYWVDKAKDEDWEPLLVILAEVDQTFAQVVRMLIKLQKAWQDFVQVWDATIGPVVSAAEAVLDGLTGGVISAVGGAISEFATALTQIVEQELVSYKDVFSWFSLKMRTGYDEHAFLWSDMLHYRKTNQMAANLLAEAQRQFGEDHDQDKLEQFQAFALGWIAHIGTDVIAHSYVNEQAGGPFRTHWQRHHLVENHIDAWNYRQARADGKGGLPGDDLAANDVYPDLSRSAFVYAVALDEEHPNGWDRPATLPADRDAAKKAVDQDGEMPAWLAEGIVRALMATYDEEGETVPTNLAGSDFANGLGTVKSGLETLLNVAGVNLNRPIDDIIAQVAPAPGFTVPKGFPLPWEVQVSYRFMISYYRLAFWGGFDLDKPRMPSVIEWPPASDLSDLASAPDFSGVNSDDPLEDICAAILALLQWLVKEVAAVVKLVADIVKAIVSPLTYPIRWALYQLAMLAWDMVNTAHDMLAHLGFVLPHGELRYPDDGELRQPNEIDKALIQLGNTVDAAFQQALADAVDPFGFLDEDPNLLVPQPNPRTERYPFFPVRPVQDSVNDADEYRRPWAYPSVSVRGDHTTRYDTPTELSDVVNELKALNVDARISTEIVRILGRTAGTVSGPYPHGALPHEVLFRTDKPVSPAERQMYEHAATPAHTDVVNEQVIGRTPDRDHSPLGDPIPFSAYLMGRIVDPAAGAVSDFNLDADRGYGYRCWDWIRGDAMDKDPRGDGYHLPVDPPEGSPRWGGAEPPNQGLVMLRYLAPEIRVPVPGPVPGPIPGPTPGAGPAPAPGAEPAGAGGAAAQEPWTPGEDPNSYTIWTGRPTK
ncbi:zinc dependent phospholipase C family protein [Catenulispora rubra]|uniref:zinc dependent phospholipase C family protein n=1 Tax=Catenulispora rubra TaxID=280293 RepID=UPI001892243A|nr:zinc dependent phospholipase C family protein [Catenulispora rubra]